MPLVTLFYIWRSLAEPTRVWLNETSLRNHQAWKNTEKGNQCNIHATTEIICGRCYGCMTCFVCSECFWTAFAGAYSYRLYSARSLKYHTAAKLTLKSQVFIHYNNVFPLFSCSLYRSLEHLGVHKPGIHAVYDDNFIDRLSYHYTNFFLLIATLIVSTKHYVGDPIQCFCPAQFTHREVFYTNYACWVSNTYYLPFQKVVPANYQARVTSDNELVYYQYVPVILLLMSFILKLPRLFWKYGIQMSGVGLKQHISILRASQSFRSDVRESRIRGIAHYLGRWTSSAKPYRAGICSGFRQRLGNYCFFGCGRHYGNYLVSLSVAVKFSYFLIEFCLLFFLNEFLGNRFYLFGYEVILSILAGKDWTTSPRFPRVTMCDFELRQLTNIQRWTFQCVLPINLYNELLFIFLWFWFTILAVLSFGNFLHTLIAYAVPVNKTTFARKHLLINDLDQTESRREFPKLVSRFVDHYLKADGIFILKLISKNSQTTDTCDLVKYLWEDFRYRYYNQRTINRRYPTSRRMEGVATLPLMNGSERVTHRYREYYL